jgi:hypothetical protein
LLLGQIFGFFHPQDIDIGRALGLLYSDENRDIIPKV